MKYSLRSLMIGITLVCVLLGGRIEYLRQWAIYHEGEAEIYVSELVAKGVTRTQLKIVRDRGLTPYADKPYSALAVHWALAREYRAAMHRPWISVNERVPNDSGTLTTEP